MSWPGNHRRLTLLTAISFLFLSSIHAGESTRLQPSAASIASSERPLSDPVVGEAVGGQYSQDVASSGIDFLVVWVDECSSRDDMTPLASLYAARVSLQGELLDPTGILNSTGRGAIDPPTVVWNGRDYIVVWTEGSAGYAALVSGTGIVQPAGGERIAEMPFSSLTVAASNGSNTLVYYVGPGIGLQPAYLMAQDVLFFSRSFNLERIVTTDPRSTSQVPRLAFDGLTYLLVWESDFDGPPTVLAIRIRKDGSLPDGSLPRPLAPRLTDQRSPVAVWNGTQFLVRWIETRVGRPQIVGRDLGADEPLGPTAQSAQQIAAPEQLLSLWLVATNPASKSLIGYLRLGDDSLVPRLFLRRESQGGRSRAVRR